MNRSTMPKLPEWVRLALRDIGDGLAPGPMLALPWLILAFTIAPLLVQPNYVFL